MEVDSQRPATLTPSPVPSGPQTDALNLSPATRSRRGRFAIDPDTCLEVFRTHWEQAQAIMGREQCPVSADDVDPVMHYLDQMLALLIEEPPPDRGPAARAPAESPPPPPGPILACALELDVFDRVFMWSCSSAGDLRERLKEQQLLLYEMVIAQSRQPLLLHRPVLRPLTKLINVCGMRSSVGVEKCLVRILHQLAICVAGDPRLLALCQNVGDLEIRRPHFLLDQLIHFMHHDGEIGLESNHALSLLIALSSRNDDFGNCIADESHFCPVLACALSGLYSRLPRKINIPSDDWHRLRQEDILRMPDMANFLRQLDFCNTVIEIGHPKIKYSLLKFIHSGFLINVLGASLHQNSLDEVIAATAYLELFLRRIRAPSLLAMFLKFIITDSYDEYAILDSLIARINYNTMLGVVTMSLFQTILDFHCEDVMYYLIFRYLIPCRHIMESQRRCIADLDGLIRSAERFQGLIPSCCLLQRDGAPSGPAGPAHAHAQPEAEANANGSNPGSLCSSASSSVLTLAAPPDGSAPSTPRHTAAAAAERAQLERCLYVDYLSDANNSITERELAVSGWEFPYDGLNPPSNVFDQPIAPASQIQSTFRRFLTKRDDSSFTTTSDDAQSIPVIESPTPPPPETPTTPMTPSEFTSDMKLKPNVSMKSAVYTLSYLDDDDDDGDDDNEGKAEADDEASSASPAHSDAEEAPSPCGPDAEGDLSYEDAVAVLQSSTNLEAFLSALSRVRPGPDEDQRANGDVFSSFDRLVASVTARWGAAGAAGLGASREPAPGAHEAEEGAPMANGEMDSGLGASGGDAPAGPMPHPAKLARPPGYRPGGPVTVGPFLTTLLCKVECMAGNSFYVNLLITGLLASLAAYPCPLLRSFLLHTGLVLQPSVKSLHHILFAVRQAVDRYSADTAHFDLLLRRARSYMQRRVEALDEDVEVGVDALSLTEAGAGGTPRRSDSLLVHLPPERRATSQTAAAPDARRRPKLLDLFSRRPGSDSPRGLLSSSRRKRKEEEELEEALSSVKTRNMVYAALILEEFTKELAALCQEHAVRPR